MDFLGIYRFKVCIRIEERKNINEFNLKKLEKDTRINPQQSTRKQIVKIKAEINERENLKKQ